ncbi:hypothetical protein GOP47_0008921 [Adiantum capillus-veneris]|uniref:Pentatricopeptide repeat-containing protein n=1 Tax=Adiantum capillus-veneris TaxID=13818 RepID=A0A9D4ZKU2_ADICA|nr:hypothetical protein GOP47_0008921 [Adiantum capillus-veneris]
MKNYRNDPSSFWAALDVEKALSILETETFPPPSVKAFSTILFKCRKQRAKEHVLRLHMYMQKHSLEAHSFLGNHLVATLVDIGSIHDAEQVFNGLEYRNDMSWHALVTGYVKQGKPLLAILLYAKMSDDDRVNLSGRTFVALLKACLMLHDFDKGLEIYAEVARLGFTDRDLFVASTLVDFYMKLGSIAKAKQLFDKLSNRDVVLWNALIAGYVNHGFGQEALHSFQQMHLHGIHPNAVTFICILKACGMLGSEEKIIAIHAEVERKGLLTNDHLLSCTLVDSYAKSGCLVKAQDVFDAQPVHNVISWTALISGYADHQHGQAALAAYAEMQDQGFFPNGVTYISLLKACGSLRDGETGKKLHCEISRMALQENNLNVGNAMIDMYCKCGLLLTAREVFDKLVQKDLVSWNTLLNGYADEELCAEALDTFERMQMASISPNAATFAGIMKACATLKSISKGQQLHMEIQKNGLFEGRHVIGNTLVDMYAKCGLLKEAEQVFSDLSLQDVFSFNALLGGYTEYQYFEIVLKLFEQMWRVGVAPDAVSFNCSLKACGSIGARDKGEQLHAEIEKMGLFDRNPMIGNALVDMYAKCGQLATSQHIFNELSVRHAVAWNALILGYADYGYSGKALELFEEMQLQRVSPDVVTFVCSLKACVSVGAINKGKELHAELARQGLLEFDLALGNTLVDMYAKYDMLSAAQETFDRLPCQDTVSWNVLLAGCTDQCHTEKVLEQFKVMQSRGVSPDDVTFITCLKACSNVGAVPEGQDIHSEIVKKGLFNLVLVSSMLVDMYAKFGLLKDAQYLFDRRHPVQDLCLWNVLIAGYAEHGESENALECLEWMRSKGISPDIISLFHSLKACGCLGAIDKGAALHMEATKKGFLEEGGVIGNSLIVMYVKCGLLAVAHNMFDRLPTQDIGSWNALIAGYDELRDNDDVFLVFDRMLGEGMRPDSVTFILLLNACSRRGLLKRASQYFEAMSKDYGIEPTSGHYTCMVDLLGRIGHLGKAMANIAELPCSSDAAMWHTFLSACEKWGSVELGRQAFEHALKVE